eukprot:CAMPEP_0171059426 /NCGR_PEP_ID=MMETSP0766_2-20121228/3169_1 /TAXON_ID=439317 /ORGANISM="Gambierdiscus australes, Strain CAWD 149" /LENGTH=59 /DNA_ID=CAMNT_0011514861 /DNA_START=625 /DNA_END=804 /DNA_ORIENTATION=-
MRYHLVGGVVAGPAREACGCGNPRDLVMKGGECIARRVVPPQNNVPVKSRVSEEHIMAK